MVGDAVDHFPPGLLNVPTHRPETLRPSTVVLGSPDGRRNTPLLPRTGLAVGNGQTREAWNGGLFSREHQGWKMMEIDGNSPLRMPQFELITSNYIELYHWIYHCLKPNSRCNPLVRQVGQAVGISNSPPRVGPAAVLMPRRGDTGDSWFWPIYGVFLNGWWHQNRWRFNGHEWWFHVFFFIRFNGDFPWDFPWFSMGFLRWFGPQIGGTSSHPGGKPYCAMVFRGLDDLGYPSCTPQGGNPPVRLSMTMIHHSLVRKALAKTIDSKASKVNILLVGNILLVYG